METQSTATYTLTQKAMADAYRVHAFNTNYTQALYPVLAQLFVWKLMGQMQKYPEVWQHLCTSMDAITGGVPLAEATITMDGEHHIRVHDVLVLASKVPFTVDPVDHTMYQRFTEALVPSMVESIDEDDIDTGVTAIRVYAEVAELVTNLLMEYLVVSSSTEMDERCIALVAMLFAETQAQCMYAFAPGLIGEGMTPQHLLELCSSGVMDWMAVHCKPGTKMEHRFNGVTVYNGILLRSVFVDMPMAEEYLLLSYHVAGNPEYRKLTQVDRDYIYFHSVLGKVEATGNTPV